MLKAKSSTKLLPLLAAAITASALAGCGGSDSKTTTGSANRAASQPAGAPVMTNNVATDGRNWLNYRRAQASMPALARNPLVDRAALGHSAYQFGNNVVSHSQVAGRPGFTGVDLLARLASAGYRFAPASYAFGEVISATPNPSGFFMAEELITAVYHRFAIFEPTFKEIGSGATRSAAGYTYFTANFTSSNGHGPGVGAGQAVTWPFGGQSGVATNFFSNREEPDPVEGQDEVGYPVSLHANMDAVLTVQAFSLRPRGGAALKVKLLQSGADPYTPKSAAAIVPLSALKAGTTYDVTFAGTLDDAPLNKAWSFTTK